MKNPLPPQVTPTQNLAPDDTLDVNAPGDTPSGDTPSGDTPSGDTPNGDTPNGDVPNGDVPNGDAPISPDKPRSLFQTPPIKAPRNWRTLQWLTPGISIKRWGVLALLGLAMSILGASFAAAEFSINFGNLLIEWVLLSTNRMIEPAALGIVLLIGGVVLVVVGLRGTFRAVERAFSREGGDDFLQISLRRRKLENGERLVVLGGGTGLSTMLRGLKEYTSNITAVVTMADDGGSSGMLRKEGLLPPGDLRNCMAALAEAEPLMTKLFQHRFEGLGPLKGHSFGNLVVAAMYEITGDFESAVRETSRVLAIRGRVLPSTLDDVRLGAELESGEEIIGQVNVNRATGIRRAFLIPETPRALPGVVEAIQDAEIIIIGPGSLFTSIIPNLLVPEIAAAIKESNAPKVYVCNVMTQPHETAGFKASDHVKAIIRHIGAGVITHALVNNGHVENDVLDRYRRVGAEYVMPDEDAIALLGVRPMHGNFVNATNLVRHDPGKLAATIFRLVAKIEK